MENDCLHTYYLEKYYQIPFKVKKYPLRDSEIPIALEDFLLKNFNIQEFVFSSLTLKLRFLVGLSTDVREVSALVCGHGRLCQSLQQKVLRCLDWI